MINKEALTTALLTGKDTPETVRLKVHIGAIGGGNIFDAMPANLNNYLHALIYSKRIQADTDSEMILCQVNNVLEVSDVSRPATKEFMRRIQGRNAEEIRQALKNINVLTN